MMGTTSELAGFLAARLDEDGEAAKRAAAADAVQRPGHAPGDWSWLGSFGQPNPGDYALIDYQVRYDPARMLREIELKRAILADHLTAAGWSSDNWPRLLRLLAAVYSDHPDYEDQWLPG